MIATEKAFLMEEIEKTVSATGQYSDGVHTISTDPDRPIVQVRDVKTGHLVAYSSTKSDFLQSMDEFMYDFFGGES